MYFSAVLENMFFVWIMESTGWGQGEASGNTQASDRTSQGKLSHSALTPQENKSHWALSVEAPPARIHAVPQGNELCLCTQHTLRSVEPKDRGRLHQEGGS